MDMNEIIEWCIAIPTALFLVWFVDKYGERINLFVDNQARRIECPFVSKLYVLVCVLTTFCTFGMLLYSILWFLDNDYDILFMVVWLYVWWMGTDTIRLYSNSGRCKHRDWQVIISMEEDGFVHSAYNYRSDVDDSVKQEISAWCPDCGALKIDGVWTNPRDIKRKYKDVRMV